jgi:hypothetical protein
MSPELEQVRHEIEHTRARIGETAAELKDTITQRVDEAAQTVNPLHYAREFPWIALGLALGAGLAIGLTGADAKAAKAAVEGAKSAGSAIGEGVVAAKDAVVEKFSGNDAAPPTEGAAEPSESAAPERGAWSIYGLLDDGLDEILGALGVSREEARRRMAS